MKLRLPSFLCAALLACMAGPASAATYLAEGVVITGVELDRADYIYKATLDNEASDRFYDGGKGRDWDSFRTPAYNIYTNNGNDLDEFGVLAPGITAGSNYLNFSKLKNDSGHCWAYTSSNMIQHWQSYYGVFANKAGETKNPTPVHGYSYDKAYVEALGGTQSLKLNKLFYDNWAGSYGGTTSTAFTWYLAGKSDSNYLTGSDPGGYFKQYFADPASTNNVSSVWSNTSAGTISQDAFNQSIKTHFGYEQAEDGSWVQTTKGQIMYLELVKNPGVSASSHAITCYGFDTDANGNVTALYIVNSDDAQYKIVKVFGKLTSAGYQLYSDEACTLTWNNWRVTGWSSINTPDALKNMLDDYESGNLTWMGNLDSWTNTAAVAADVNVLPTDETGWMTYAGTGDNAGYYNSYYTNTDTRGVEFNDEATNSTVKVAEDISVASMTVNNTELDYSFLSEGAAKTITTGSLSKTGTGALLFDNTKLYVEGAVTANGNSITFTDDANIGSIDKSALVIKGGTTTVRNTEDWTRLTSLELSDQARLMVGASLEVAGNISETEAVGTLAEGTTSGINATYCIKVGTDGDASTGNVKMAGDMTAGSYIQILKDADIGGNVASTGTQWGTDDSYITIGGNATIGGNLSAANYISIGGNATIGGNLNAAANVSVNGNISIDGTTTINGTLTADTATLKGNASIANLGTGTSLNISGGTTTLDKEQWWNLGSLSISQTGRLTAKGSVKVADNLSTSETATGTLPEGTKAGINAQYCIEAGTWEGDTLKAGTGDVTLNGDMSAGAYIKIGGNANVTGNLTSSGTADDHIITIGGNADIGGKLSGNKAVTIGGDATLGGNAAIGGDLTVGGTLTSKEGAGQVSVEAGGKMTLGGDVSNVALKAQTLTMGAADGGELTLDSVSMVITGGEATLTNVKVTETCSFSTGVEGQALTLNANGVTFVLEGPMPQAQTFALFSADPLTETQTATSALVINSSMLEGLDINGSVTLDLSNWQSEIESGNYDSVVLDLGDTTFSETQTVQVTLGEDVLAQITPDAGNTGGTGGSGDTGSTGNSFTFTIPQQPGEAIPEPTTATLSLLALAALAARRRRK